MTDKEQRPKIELLEPSYSPLASDFGNPKDPETHRKLERWVRESRNFDG